MTEPRVIIRGGLAPVLIVERVFDEDLCGRLIAHFEAEASFESGVMRERDGLTVHCLDSSVKRRTDCAVTSPELSREINQRLTRHVRPAIQIGFNFDATRVERHLIACYDGAHEGHFAAHRDNTTKGTAHRRFACTINLNEEHYLGGELQFPEIGDALYRCPTGSALLFSCSLLHRALPVTHGRRYAFLPFFYDEVAAELRKENLVFLEPSTAKGIRDAEQAVQRTGQSQGR